MSREVLLKIHDADSLSKTVAGMRVNAMILNGKRFLIQDFNIDQKIFDGLKSLEVSGTGVFLNSACECLVSEAFFSIKAMTYMIIIPAFGYFEGMFLISQYGHEKSWESEPTFSMTMKSVGDIKFAAL